MANYWTNNLAIWSHWWQEEKSKGWEGELFGSYRTREHAKIFKIFLKQDCFSQASAAFYSGPMLQNCFTLSFWHDAAQSWISLMRT